MDHNNTLIEQHLPNPAKPRYWRNLWRFVAVPMLCIVCLVAFLCFFAARWYISVYGNTGFDSILFTLTGGLNGVQSGLIKSFLLKGALPAVLCTAATCTLLFFPWTQFLGKNLIAKLCMVSWVRPVSALLSVSLSSGLVVTAANQSGLTDYIEAINSSSSLFESYYKDPNDVTITFPEEKRNVIYIILESMETSYLSKEEGGAMEQNLIPELTQLAENSINFSHNTGVGGLVEVSGTSWTVGSLVGQTSGVPLKVPSGIKDWQNGYGKDGEFLPGLTTLFEVLKEAGYHQTLMVGSDANFGGRKTYYETHGIDKVYDYYTARDEDKVIAEDYFVWWGYEDHNLFRYAKMKLAEISKQEQPFFFSMLTVDTHHIGGYRCRFCNSTYEENYENAIACSSKQVAAFVEWIQRQDFYENTTIIITGDHFSMDRDYFKRTVDATYQRHGYNCFVNVAATPVQTKNRSFCALDMFPTTLAAMGCKIEGEHLGLGTNLFSGKPTLIETMGYQRFDHQLSLNSDYYAEQFRLEIPEEEEETQ